jgi:hypothetical protein
LYGGSAVALRYGHRASLDFGFRPLNYQIVLQKLRQSGRALDVLQNEKNSLSVVIEPANVKLSFFGELGMGA